MRADQQKYRSPGKGGGAAEESCWVQIWLRPGRVSIYFALLSSLLLLLLLYYYYHYYNYYYYYYNRVSTSWRRCKASGKYIHLPAGYHYLYVTVDYKLWKCTYKYIYIIYILLLDRFQLAEEALQTVVDRTFAKLGEFHPASLNARFALAEMCLNCNRSTSIFDDSPQHWLL